MASEKIQSDGVVYLPDSKERVPMSIVWTTLPGISLFFPFIGHVGVGDSSGITYDFSGPYQVTVGSLMGGPAKRTCQLDPCKFTITNGKTPVEAYDTAVRNSACVYGKRMHNLFLDNCHSHAALVLNQIGYDGKSNWNQVSIFKFIWLKGKWDSKRRSLKVFGPCAVLLLVIAFLSVLVPLVTR